MNESEALRTNVLKLKYKIEKEHDIKDSLTRRRDLLRQVSFKELGLERALTRIHLLLREKGMTLKDWMLCVPYQDDGNMGALVRVLHRIGINIQRGEQDLLLHFSQEKCSQTINEDELEEMVRRSGLKWQ